MTSIWLPLGTAVIGALAVLCGQALNPSINARRAHQQWLRDKKAELIEELNVILRDARHQLQDAVLHWAWRLEEVPGFSAQEEDERLDNVYKRMSDAVGRLEIYASSDLIDAAWSALAAYQVGYGVFSLREIPRELHPADCFQAFEREVEFALAEFRHELGVERRTRRNSQRVSTNGDAWGDAPPST